MNRFIVNRREAKIMGVGAGIADVVQVDPLLVRLGLIALVLVTGPVAIPVLPCRRVPRPVRVKAGQDSF